MILKSLEVANFRKFRDTLRIDGFTDGLNIVVEPNETGKSTLLEALRAAFFVRHSAKTELVRSYVPTGDEVAPRVAVEFSLKGQHWTLEKQFMKAPSVRLTGSGGRRESDAAEEALQELLGFERGNNRGSDPETRGPLGMLWVEQMKGLEIESPNRIVRDSVRGVLEAEIGAVTGGRRFDAIRASVEAAHGALRTPSTGRSKGDLAAAEARLATATSARQQAEAAFREYEQQLNDLDGAKARLRIVERDLADPEAIEERRKLEADVKTAETVSLRVSAAEAQHGRAEELAKAAAAWLQRLDAAEGGAGEAEAEAERLQLVRAAAQVSLEAGGVEERSHRSTLEGLRTGRIAKENALSAARSRQQDFAAAAGARRAAVARTELAALESRERELVTEAAKGISAPALEEAARLEREEVAALARFEAGSVRVHVQLAEGVELRIDGRASDPGSVDVLTETSFDIGSSGSVTVRPPQGSGRSIEADLAAAREQLAAKLRSLGISSHAEGVARTERAASARRELEELRKRISAACPGDPVIGLAPGADALRAFAIVDGADHAPVAPEDDIGELERELTQARLEEVAAAATHEEARSALVKAESALAVAASDAAAAARRSQAARESLDTVLADGDRDRLDAACTDAQRAVVVALGALEQAREGAKAFDLGAIRRRIDNLDRASRRAGDERLELTGRIASLEATIAREGTVGPAGRVAEAVDEEAAAAAACDRLRHEADTLEMLREALAEAAAEASRTFLTPVSKRAGRYIEQLLPGCALTFDEGLGLANVTRAGLEECCGDLSRGTQEQLAILTRLAFADLLLEDGAPISLILDDPLVYSDDARLEVMTNMLHEASARMQVILLTCRSKAFRHVDGNRIMLP